MKDQVLIQGKEMEMIREFSKGDLENVVNEVEKTSIDANLIGAEGEGDTDMVEDESVFKTPAIK